MSECWQQGTLLSALPRESSGGKAQRLWWPSGRRQVPSEVSSFTYLSVGTAVSGDLLWLCQLKPRHLTSPCSMGLPSGMAASGFSGSGSELQGVFYLAHEAESASPFTAYHRSHIASLLLHFVGCRRVTNLARIKGKGDLDSPSWWGHAKWVWQSSVRWEPWWLRLQVGHRSQSPTWGSTVVVAF